MIAHAQRSRIHSKSSSQSREINKTNELIMPLTGFYFECSLKSPAETGARCQLGFFGIGLSFVENDYFSLAVYDLFLSISPEVFSKL